MRRFHLSTLLLLTVLAGAFIGANVSYREGTLERERLEYRYRGFPLEWWTQGTRPFYLRLVANGVAGVAGLALVGYVSEKIAWRRNPK
ncbi:MAG TPA: hypothetical protein VEK08_26040 [Planctomycetota bacterium]|nr:hypothetical protein [Planctomycetota bacterium]